MPEFESLKEDPLEFVALAKHILTVEDVQTERVELLDITVTIFLVLISGWRREITGQLRVIHDESSKLKHVEQIWRKLTDSIPLESTTSPHHNDTKFPIGVQEVLFGDSSAYEGLQLADVFAGVVYKYLMWKSLKGESKDDFFIKLDELMANSLGGHAILPSPKVTPKDLGTIGIDGNETVEQIARILRR